MRHVDLCSGIGGFALGFEWAGLSTPVLFCDIEPWCRSVLRKHWPHVPIHSDVKELANDAERLIPDCDILTAGYPCQPFSVAGKREGEKDDRHIWPYIRQIVAHKRPTWTVFENVYGHISMGLDQVLLDLEAEGYTTRTFVVPAAGVDAPHRRDRVWIVGYTENNGCDRGSEGVGREGTESQQDELQLEIWSELSGPSQDVAYADSKGLQRQWKESCGTSKKQHNISNTCRWETEPDVGRVANGVPKRVDRLKGLGNAIVPQIAQQIGTAIRMTHV